MDHIVVVCADLDTGVAWLEDALGVSMLAGGAHARYGTHNRLLGLSDGLYLEVIAPDPLAEVAVPRWFALDDAPAIPRWGNWIYRTDDIAAHKDLTGPAMAMARGGLAWDITVPPDGSLPMDGGFPTLIKWDAQTAHPATQLPDSGCRLIKWEVFHAQAGYLRETCAMDDDRIVFTPAVTPRFAATFDTPNGLRVIG